MKKWVTICMLGILLTVSFLLQPFAAVSLAREQCDCENESATAAASVMAGDALASRSGVANSNAAFVTYTVKPGDTLSQLAQQFNADVQTLIALNNVTDPRTLQIGQTLTIPKQLSPQEIPAVTGIDKIMTVTLTAYTSGPESTGKYPGHPAYGITSTGKRATEGRTIAVDPRIIPYGSKVYIEGVGIRTAEDTGGAIKGDRIDVYMEDVGQAIQFGVKKNVRVYVLSSPNS